MHSSASMESYAESSYHCGGPLANAILGGVAGSPRCPRIPVINSPTLKESADGLLSLS